MISRYIKNGIQYVGRLEKLHWLRISHRIQYGLELHGIMQTSRISRSGFLKASALQKRLR